MPQPRRHHNYDPNDDNSDDAYNTPALTSGLSRYPRGYRRHYPNKNDWNSDSPTFVRRSSHNRDSSHSFRAPVSHIPHRLDDYEDSEALVPHRCSSIQSNTSSGSEPELPRGVHCSTNSSSGSEPELPRDGSRLTNFYGSKDNGRQNYELVPVDPPDSSGYGDQPAHLLRSADRGSRCSTSQALSPVFSDSPYGLVTTAGPACLLVPPALDLHDQPPQTSMHSFHCHGPSIYGNELPLPTLPRRSVASRGHSSRAGVPIAHPNTIDRTLQIPTNAPGLPAPSHPGHRGENERRGRLQGSRSPAHRPTRRVAYPKSDNVTVCGLGNGPQSDDGYYE